jgi:uncharacterized protein (DUF433 family)
MIVPRSDDDWHRKAIGGAGSTPLDAAPSRIEPMFLEGDPLHRHERCEPGASPLPLPLAARRPGAARPADEGIGMSADVGDPHIAAFADGDLGRGLDEVAEHAVVVAKLDLSLAGRTFDPDHPHAIPALIPRPDSGRHRRGGRIDQARLSAPADQGRGGSPRRCWSSALASPSDRRGADGAAMVGEAHIDDHQTDRSCWWGDFQAIRREVLHDEAAWTDPGGRDTIGIVPAQLITSDPNVMMGKPVVVGTRVTVELILEKLAAGETVEQILAAHPRLTEKGIRAALAFAAEAIRADVVYPLGGDVPGG